MSSYYEKIGDGDPFCIDDELPFELPDGWSWTRTKSILATLLSGSDLKPHQYNADNDGMPYMTGASNIASGQLVVNRWTSQAKNISLAGDILLTCKGTVGLTAINSIGNLHIARQFMALRTIEDSSLQVTDYLKVVLSLIAPLLADQSNGLIPGIDRKAVLEILIALPPLAEQQRIVNSLDTVIPIFLDAKSA